MMSFLAVTLSSTTSTAADHMGQQSCYGHNLAQEKLAVKEVEGVSALWRPFFIPRPHGLTPRRLRTRASPPARPAAAPVHGQSYERINKGKVNFITVNPPASPLVPPMNEVPAVSWR